MKMLFLDIETAPCEGYFWETGKQSITPMQIKTPAYILCWAAMWRDASDVMWDGINESAPRPMLDRMADLLDQAEIVCHYWGSRFDIPWINSQLARHNIKPPSPFRQIDLKVVVAKQFYLPSYKLEFVAPYFGVGEKVLTGGFKLWLDCMAGDPAAWDRMQRYNMQDVRVIAALYQKLLPWVPMHPHMGEPGTVACPYCGSVDYQRRGYYTAKTLTYQRYRCKECGGWYRGTSSKGLPRQITTSITR